MATANNETGADAGTSENSDRNLGEPPPYNSAIKEDEFPRIESQTSFVSIDLDFQERVFNAGYDQDNKSQNKQSFVQYDDNFYQPTSQPYSNLGKIRAGYMPPDVQTNNKNSSCDPWCNGTMQTKLHIQISQKNTPIKESAKHQVDTLDKCHSGYDQPLTHIPNFQTNFNIGFTSHSVPNTNNIVIEQPKAQFFKPDKPSTMLIPAIFACICFFPTGICAIISAINAKNAVERGDLNLAEKYTRITQRWTFCSIVIGLVWITATIVTVTTSG